MADKSQKPLLTSQREALKTYLEDLLLEVEAYEEDAQAPLPEPRPTSAQVSRQTSTGEDKSAQNEATLAPATAANPCPWIEFPIQVLTFEIADTLYAAPLKNLHGIIPMPERLTQVPTKIEWFLGLFRNRGINVKVISLVKLWQCKNAKPAKDKYDDGYILLIDEGRFGFAVSNVRSVLTITEADVQWRSNPGLSGVLAGNIRGNMATLIDLNALNAGLQAGTWTGPR